MNDEHAKIIFKLLNNHANWQSKARKLRHCADLLFNAFLATKSLSDEEQAETQDSEIDDVATLLYGMAMENILKARLLKEGVAIIEPTGEVVWNAEGAKNHDLLGICSSLKSIRLESSEKNLIERLSAFVSWAGKYPTPLAQIGKREFKGFHLSNQPRAGINNTRPLPFDIEDKDMFDRIFKSISRGT